MFLNRIYMLEITETDNQKKSTFVKSPTFLINKS